MPTAHDRRVRPEVEPYDTVDCRHAIPGVVFEIVLGIVIGPAVLDIAHPDSIIVAFEALGLSYLMFLAGVELELSRIRGRSLQLASTGWMISLALPC